MNNNRVWLFLALILVLSCVLVLPSGNLVFSKNVVNSDAIYTFYSLSHENFADTITIKNGDQYMIRCSYDTAKNIKPKLQNLVGESVSYGGTYLQMLQLIKLLNLSVIKTENICDAVLIYGYNKNLGKCSYLGNKKVNAQLAFNNGTITLGYPIILGDY